MKECPSCKAKNQNDAGFCVECGADLKDVPAQADEWTAAAGDFLNKAKGAAAAGAKKAAEAAKVGAKKAQEAARAGVEKAQQTMDDMEKKAAEAKAGKVTAGGWDSAMNIQAAGSSSRSGASAMLVDQGESIVATIGSNYLQNYLSGGSVSKGIGILTQKRFYFKGRNFSGEGKAMKSTTEEGVVSIDDIAFTMFSHTRHIGALILAILLTVAAAILTVAVYGTGFVFGGIALAASIPFYIMFFVNRQTLFKVTFPGGSFGFDIRYYPIADIRDFQRQLHLLKDHIKEGGDA